MSQSNTNVGELAANAYASFVQSGWAFYVTEEVDNEGNKTGNLLMVIRVESANGSTVFFVPEDFAEFLGRQFLKNVKRMRKMKTKLAMPNKEKKLIIPDIATGREKEIVIEDDEDDAEADAIMAEEDEPVGSVETDPDIDETENVDVPNEPNGVVELDPNIEPISDEDLEAMGLDAENTTVMD